MCVCLCACVRACVCVCVCVCVCTKTKTVIICFLMSLHLYMPQLAALVIAEVSVCLGDVYPILNSMYLGRRRRNSASRCWSHHCTRSITQERRYDFNCVQLLQKSYNSTSNNNNIHYYYYNKRTMIIITIVTSYGENTVTTLIHKT